MPDIYTRSYIADMLFDGMSVRETIERDESFNSLHGEGVNLFITSSLWCDHEDFLPSLSPFFSFSS